MDYQSHSPIFGWIGSFFIHGLLIVVLIATMNLTSPAVQEEKEETVQVQLVSAPPPEQTPPPTPQRTPRRTPSPTPEPVRENEIVVAEATPEKTPKPTPKPTQTPKKTPKPTPEPTKTPKPTPNPTAKPTKTPKPEPTKTPEPKPEPTPERNRSLTPEEMKKLYEKNDITASGRERKPEKTPTKPSPPSTTTSSSDSSPIKMSGSTLSDNYKRAALGKVSRYFTIPKSKERSQTAIVAFTILKNGAITNIQLKKSCGDPALDKLAIDALKKAKTFGALPDGSDQTSVRHEIEFSMRQ